MDAESCTLAVGHGVDDLSAAVDAISTSEVARIPRPHGCRIHQHAAVLQLQTGDLRKKFNLALLPQGFHHHAHLQAELRTGDRSIAAAAACVSCAALGSHAFKGRDAAFAIINHASRLRLPDEGYRIL